MLNAKRVFAATSVFEKCMSYNLILYSERVDESIAARSSCFVLILAGIVIPIQRRFGRLALETLAAMLAHIALPHVGMASIIEQPLEPRLQQTFHGGDKAADKDVTFEELTIAINIPSFTDVGCCLHHLFCARPNGCRGVVCLRIRCI